MDFKKDDYVVYRNAGVCQIVEMESQCMDGEHTLLYYKMKPLAEPNSTHYVPVQAASERLRALLSKEQVLHLIDHMPDADDVEDLWSDNRRERKERYSQIMKGDNHMAMLQLIASLYFKKLSMESTGKRFSAMDETAMKNAEGLMLQEFGVVLNLTEPEVRKLIEQRVSGRNAD